MVKIFEKEIIVILIIAVILSFLPQNPSNISSAADCCYIGPGQGTASTNDWCFPMWNRCTYGCSGNTAWTTIHAYSSRWFFACWCWLSCLPVVCSIGYWYCVQDRNVTASVNCGSSGYSNNYQCSGDTLQREYVNRGCELKYTSGTRDGSCDKQPDSEYHSGVKCYANPEWKEDTNCCAGTGCEYCEEWSAPYCKDNDVYHKGICHQKGCGGSPASCYDNQSEEEEKIQECGEGGYVDEFRCVGDNSQQKYIEKGCLAGSCYETAKWGEPRTNCAATCFPEILKQGCESGTYTCDPGTGKCALPYQSCKPPQYTSSGTACECNTGLGTVTKVCNGSGNCIETEEKCHTGCGAVGACHGLKSGDLNPENPALKCCKGGEWLPKWKETAP